MKRHSGFTIVELLIVIVVIGILAAITIIAYNGISSKAVVASLQSDLENDNKQMLAYLTTSSTGYPTAIDCSASPAANTICLKSSGATTYQFSVDNSSLNNPSYCITATNGTKSYYIGTSTSAQTVGACPGHGVGGIAAITNLVNIPIGPSQAAGSGPTIQPNNYYINTAAADTTEHAVQLTTAVPAAGIMTETAWVKHTVAGYINLKARSALSGTTTYYSLGSANVPANVWTLISGTISLAIPAGSTSAGVYISNYLSSDVMYVSAPMFTQGSTQYTYADGNSPNWVWNGTTNNSTSTGPPQ